LAGVDIEFEITTTATHINMTARRWDNDAVLVDYAFPITFLPAGVDPLMTPGFGFYDEASNSHWIDDFEVWGPDNEFPFGAGHGDLRFAGGAADLRAQRRLAAAAGDLRFEGLETTARRMRRMVAAPGDFRTLGG